MPQSNPSILPRRTTFGACLLAAALLSAQGAGAAMSHWADNEGGRMRIVTLPPEQDGTVQGGLQIEPKSGWITYWKEPGQAGIPPQITLLPGKGIAITAMRFPVPKAFEAGGVRDLGYDQPITLPFTLKVDDINQPLKLNASAFIGLCRNICIPFQADFQLDLGATKGLPLEENLILDTARRNLPEAQSADFSVVDHTLSSDRSALTLAIRLPEAATPPQIFVAGPEGHVLFDQVNGRHVDGLYRVDMPVRKLPKGYDPKGKRWDILVLSGTRAMETSLAFD